jgi:hypothetical protein
MKKDGVDRHRDKVPSPSRATGPCETNFDVASSPFISRRRLLIDIGTISFTLEAHDRQRCPTCQLPKTRGTGLGSSL